MNTYKKGFAPVLALLLVLGMTVGAGVTVYLASNRNANYNPDTQAKSNASDFARRQTATPSGYYKNYNPGVGQKTVPITGRSEIMTIKDDLDRTNPETFNTDLKANDTDAASF